MFDIKRRIPIQHGPFQGCSRMGVAKKNLSKSFLKICQTYPKMMKLGTVILYFKKIRNI